MSKTSILHETPSNRSLARGRELRARYLDRGGLPNDLRVPIARSWQRCRGGGVSPALRRPAADLGAEALGRCRDRQAALLRAVAPLFDDLHAWVADQGVIVHLSDRQGRILEAVSDPETFERARQYGLVPGGDWSEAAAGTNAIGTALVEGRPLQVRGGEHFCDGPQHWSCTAAPFRDPRRGGVLGVLNISTDARRDPALMLPLAQSLARNLEQALVLDLQRSRERLLGGARQRLAYREPLILFDRDGRLVQANRRALRLLGRRPTLAGPGPGATPPWLPAEADPLLATLDPAWVEPLWLRGELAGYLARLPDDGAEADAPPARDVAPAGEWRAMEYLAEIPAVRRALHRLLQGGRQPDRGAPTPSRAGRLQQSLACSAELVHALDELAQAARGAAGTPISRATLQRVISGTGHHGIAPAEVRLDWPAGLRLEGDGRGFCQVIANLLDNSAVHGFGGRGPGRIDIRGEVEEGRLVLHYRDDGRGMDEATRLQLEDPFFTTCPARHRGLGAFLIRTLVVHLYRGRVHWASQPGQGIQCRIEIPLAGR